MEIKMQICPLLSDSNNTVRCHENECAFFERNFDSCSITVIANQLIEIQEKLD